MPIAGLLRGESPDDTSPGQPSQYVRLVGDVFRIIEIDKTTPNYGPESHDCDKSEQAKNQQFPWNSIDHGPAISRLIRVHNPQDPMPIHPLRVLCDGCEFI